MLRDSLTQWHGTSDPLVTLFRLFQSRPLRQPQIKANSPIKTMTGVQCCIQIRELSFFNATTCMWKWESVRNTVRQSGILMGEFGLLVYYLIAWIQLWIVLLSHVCTGVMSCKNRSFRGQNLQTLVWFQTFFPSPRTILEIIVNLKRNIFRGRGGMGIISIWALL